MEGQIGLEPRRECTHIPLTTLHLSISWCSLCQHWLLHWSQSGRRETSGELVLIEFLRHETITQEASGPDELALWAQGLLMEANELEDDRRDTDALMPRRHLRSI